MNSVWLLQSFISEDSVIVAHPLIDDENLATFVLAWRFIDVEWQPPKELIDPPADRKQLWEMLWSFVDWSMEDMVIASGMDETEVLLLFDRSKMLRLIYPNGTIAPSANRLLELRVGEELSRMVGVMDQVQQRKAALGKGREKKLLGTGEDIGGDV